MIIKGSIATYPILAILVKRGKRTFENMGRMIKTSGDTVRRMLRPGDESLKASQKIAQEMFAKKKTLVLAIDETTIKKSYSTIIQGVFHLFDLKIGQSSKGYKALVAVITDGKHTIPIKASFSFGKEFYEDAKKARQVAVKFFIAEAQKLFPGVRIVVVLDGAFSSIEFMQWALKNKIDVEIRMPSNRVVVYKGRRMQIKLIFELIPNGLKMSRTRGVLWNGLYIYITAVRRIDRHGNESIVYQASTFEASSNEHAKFYKQRWGIEKMFRTTKQSLGLQECFSTKIAVQYDHMCAIFLAHAIAQMEMRKKNYKNPEEAIKAFDRKNHYTINNQLRRLDRANDAICA